MNKLGIKMLFSQRCYMRKLEISDAQQLFENIFSDTKVSRYMSWNNYTDVAEVENYLTKWQENYNQNECYWGVFLKENDILIGTVYLCDENISAEVGFILYCFGSEFLGNGYAAETVKVVLQYGFNEIGYNNITTFVAKSNYRSQNVLSRLGFKCEATLRQRDKTDFCVEDCLSYSLLKSEINGYICKIATIEEMECKWDYEIKKNKSLNWKIWKTEAIERVKNGQSVAYYGILNNEIICEATAMLNKNIVQNSENLVDVNTAYLCAFRTVEKYQGKGYFSMLFKFVIDDLKGKGYENVTLGVEPTETKNLKIYQHLGFNKFIKSGKEFFPDGKFFDVDYYIMELL